MESRPGVSPRRRAADRATGHRRVNPTPEPRHGALSCGGGGGGGGGGAKPGAKGSAKKRARPEPSEPALADECYGAMVDALKAAKALMRPPLPEQGADAPARLACALFNEKPSREVYPDYYEIVAKPIDLATIQRKAKGKKYASVRAFRDDVELLRANAHTYNEEGSWVCDDADAIAEEVERVMAEREAGGFGGGADGGASAGADAASEAGAVKAAPGGGIPKKRKR